ncbi:ABC transporter permease [Actinokineospora iranica]|uniref:ABC-2 type transport system permease protein n=1 Tax=Actinokineospora iranica TaxID=1271860 RepID=A0A1G6LQV3_9PSEU|nr:ABC-2 family transporter protein [Actinokineospora iranica]SDC45571.1 ABC-2 type transport system permease protein [Actinokineospora iranica]
MPRVPWALTAAGFRRYATYRQATFAGAFTNVIFGFLRCYILLAVAAEVGGAVAGYDGPKLVAFVWLGQGLLAVVSMWTMLDLAERVRSGDVVADLLRPINPLWTYLWTEFGRAGYAMLTRFVAPLVVGIVAFTFYIPQNWVTYPLFAVSIGLAVLVGFACRYLIGLTAFWLLDIRGVSMFWGFATNIGSGLAFPLAILPDWLATALWVGTPLPALLQAPIDIAVERGGVGHSLLLLAGQAAWGAGLLLVCRWVQARAVRRLVVQGG